MSRERLRARIIVVQCLIQLSHLPLGNAKAIPRGCEVFVQLDGSRKSGGRLPKSLEQLKYNAERQQNTRLLWRKLPRTGKVAESIREVVGEALALARPIPGTPVSRMR